MKKIFVILGAVTMVGLSSCQKDWSCLCTDQSGVQTSHAINNTTLISARSKCKDMNYNYPQLGTSQSCSIQ